jgi:hypothetical protein
MLPHHPKPELAPMNASVPRLIYSVVGGFVLTVLGIVSMTMGSTFGISIALLVLSAVFVISHLVMDKNPRLRIAYVVLTAVSLFHFHAQEASIQLVENWPDAAEILESPMKYRSVLTSTGLAATCFWIGLATVFRKPKKVQEGGE